MVFLLKPSINLKEDKMKKGNQINNQRTQSILRVTTANVTATLSPEEIQAAFKKLHECMKIPDPENPNLWVIMINDHKLWGILDHRAGPLKEDVLTILFPEDY